jgi:hypothetical protein
MRLAASLAGGNALLQSWSYLKVMSSIAVPLEQGE